MVDILWTSSNELPLKQHFRISVQIPPKYVCKGPIDNKLSLGLGFNDGQ